MQDSWDEATKAGQSEREGKKQQIGVKNLSLPQKMEMAAGFEHTASTISISSRQKSKAKMNTSFNHAGRMGRSNKCRVVWTVNVRGKMLIEAWKHTNKLYE